MVNQGKQPAQNDYLHSLHSFGVRTEMQSLPAVCLENSFMIWQRFDGEKQTTEGSTVRIEHADTLQSVDVRGRMPAWTAVCVHLLTI
jgi:hypothetical protein